MWTRQHLLHTFPNARRKVGVFVSACGSTQTHVAFARPGQLWRRASSASRQSESRRQALTEGELLATLSPMSQTSNCLSKESHCVPHLRVSKSNDSP